MAADSEALHQVHRHVVLRAFSRALSHCTTATVGRRVHKGAAIDENGAKKSSTTRSAGASAFQRRSSM